MWLVARASSSFSYASRNSSDSCRISAPRLPQRLTASGIRPTYCAKAFAVIPQRSIPRAAIMYRSRLTSRSLPGPAITPAVVPSNALDRDRNSAGSIRGRLGITPPRPSLQIVKIVGPGTRKHRHRHQPVGGGDPGVGSASRFPTRLENSVCEPLRLARAGHVDQGVIPGLRGLRHLDL